MSSRNSYWHIVCFDLFKFLEVDSIAGQAVSTIPTVHFVGREICMKLGKALGFAAALLTAVQAWSSPVTLTFERPGSTVGVAGRQLVGSTYSGFTFGANLYYLTSPSGQPGFDTTDSSPGALWVWDGATTGGSVTTTIASTVGFNTFAFDWNAAQSFTLTFLDASGNALSDITLGSGVSGFQGWGAYPAVAATTFSIGGTATSVEISGASNDLFLDNLTFGLVSGGGTAPEPGSIALVGLALVAAWGSRRKVAT